MLFNTFSDRWLSMCGVACKADRVKEALSLACLVGLHLTCAQVKGSLPSDTHTLILGLAQNGLLSLGLMMTGSVGTLVSAYARLLVRYHSAPLEMEVVLIGSRPGHGPASIVCLPYETSNNGEAKLYVANRLQGVPVPAPFAPEAEVMVLGWNPERFRALE